MTGYEAYKLYVALKNHFNSDTYDYFRYGGKTRANAKSFEMRPDKYFFIKLAKHKDPEKYVLANIIEDSTNVWVGELVNEQKAEDNYKRWLSRQESLTYIFTEELNELDEEYNNNFTVATISTNVATHTVATYLAGTSSIAQLEGTIATALGAAADLSFANTDNILVAVDDGASTMLVRVVSAADGAAIAVAELSLVGILQGVTDATTLAAGNFVFA